MHTIIITSYKNMMCLYIYLVIIIHLENVKKLLFNRRLEHGRVSSGVPRGPVMVSLSL